MSIDLPKPIAAYFDADAQSAVAVACLFTPDAVVTDEGRTHSGRAGIAAWKAAASAAFRYSSTPIAVRHDGDHVVVTGHVAGDFPGSPVDLRYLFTIAGDEIAALEIKP